MTGCGAPGAPGIIRCLRKNGERDIRIVAVDRNENAGARDLVDAFYTVPSAEKEDFLPAVLDICRRESVQVVIPIVTRELMKFARARAEFEALGAKVSVMEPDKLEIVNNKAHLLDAMRAHGLRTPEYRRVHTVEKLKAAVSALGYPEKALCVKAAVGNGSRGIRMLNANISRFDLFFEQKPNSMFISYEELIRTLSERETMPEMLVMEYLPGTEYSVDFLADHGEPIYTVSRRGLSVVTSNMMSLVVDDNPAVKEICTQVVRSLELDGNFGFDLLYNANDETPYVIEINPRLTAGVVSCAAAGVNLPYLGMKRLLGEPLPELTPHFGTRMSRRYQEAFFDADLTGKGADDMKKVLVLAPHTDDGELGCGGTVARLLEEGCEVHFAVFSTCAESVPAGFPADELKTEFLSAMESYGIPAEQLILFDFQVRHFPAHRQEILEELVRLNRRIVPDLVLAPSLHDVHQDHHTIAEEAIRAFKRTSILGYEEPWNNLTFNNQVYVTLEERHVEKKIAAVERYISQRGRIYASGEYIRALAMSHGVQIGRQYAEVFETERWIL